ncbi:MAG: N-6 DNA methylase [Alphaproteobacteria bacterium]|nr:N-6 DNA methylase [Alphaproteobacteria bacterium]
MAGMSPADPNLEWLGHVQPIGLVVAPRVLSERGLVPAEQTRADTEEAQAVIPEDGPAEPWAIATTLLGWQPALVAGAPGGPEIPDDLSAWVPEAETRLAPDWAVQKPGGGWQILAQILPAGIDPDTRGALAGWEATPHQRLERLLRETGIPIGLLISDTAWRLVYAPRGETSGWLRFPLAPMRLVAGRPMLGGFKLLLERFRLFNDAPTHRLPAVLLDSRAAQAAVSATLASQVLGALHELLRGFNAADPARMTTLARTNPSHVYEGLLTVLLRLVFLLYAEDRDLIPSRNDAAARGLYQRGYGVRGLHARLLDDLSKNPDTMDERTGAWGRLLALFRLVHTGDGTGWIRGRGGALFDPAKFPFLQGQNTADAPFAIPRLSDGIVQRVLDQLLVLGGERLSYRTLDVEQIGSVYETVMGFSVLAAPGPALAIAAGKNNRTPVFVDLAHLAKLRGKDRLRALKDDYSRAQLTPKLAAAIEAARDEAALATALTPLVDERGSPGAAITPAGTLILQPTDERRRTGSHYTPRSLTEPIVRHALEPAFARIGADATPADVLALKVCDPAMGSGAFLVEACRQLATRLVAAWARHADTRPPIPPDEDEDLLARRIVAQRCLYGVDRNPLAVDLARLSLWLATLARDHEFTFLDHALKSGDSLVGLTAKQIGRLAWRDDQADFAPFFGFLRERVAEAVRARGEIQNAPDDIARAIQEQRHRHIETRLDDIRNLGDAVIAAFFSTDRARAQDNARKQLGIWASRPPEEAWPRFRTIAAELRAVPHPLRPFHWPVEFPEVFAGNDPGFDAIVGNPPFAGKNTLINGHRSGYLPWLQTLHEGAHGNADLVAHFFRRSFGLLRRGGCFGLIATNTVGQGDTRETGLRAILAQDGNISAATRRLVWPGEAAVVVAVVHMTKGPVGVPRLDGRPVRRISAYLVEGDLDTSPQQLEANSSKVFEGSKIYGSGFTFDNDGGRKGLCENIDKMTEIVENDIRNSEVIYPYIGGEELSSNPQHLHHRYVIDFEDYPLRRDNSLGSWTTAPPKRRSDLLKEGIVPDDYSDPVAADWPDLLSIVERFVKPERAKVDREARRKRWWRFGDRQPGLYRAIREQDYVLAISRVSPQFSIARLPSRMVFADSLDIFTFSDYHSFAILQSRVHEIWARFFSSSMKDDLRYTPSDCFRTFPFAAGFATEVTLGASGETYLYHRAASMIAQNEGLTKTYNRFHDATEYAPDIARLRDLHHAMDVAVLRAYGWHDLADTAAPIFLDETNEDDHRYQGRLFWPAPFRETILARLLALNAERAAQERAAGLAPLNVDDSLEDEPA